MERPIVFSIKNKQKIQELQARSVRFVDTLKEQLEELCEIRFPSLRDRPTIMEKKKKGFCLANEKKSVWCYYPWRQICTRLLAEPLYQELRTARNKNLITALEQKKFSACTVAIAGLSVGSNIARLCTLQGGPREMRLADADTISLSNLNRILVGNHALGRRKTDVLAEELFETDPFLSLHLFPQGLQEKNITSFCRGVDIVVEETDDMAMKIALRKWCKTKKKPLISILDNGDGVLVDIERYDEGYSLNHFMSRLKVLPPGMATAPFREKAMAITKFIGIHDVATRMIESIHEVGSSLYSWPQLGGAATLAGIAGAFCIRYIACGYPLPSGRYAISLPDIFKITV